MNAIILTALLGVLLMFTGAFVKDKSIPKYLAITGAILLCIVNSIELYTRAPFFDINFLQMLRVDNFSLVFMEVIFLAMLLFFLLSGKDFERIGEHVAEYFALIFFVLCGATLSVTYNTLLILFLGIEILSIPLYVLTGADKRNLKSNEAAIKYFLMGSFSTGILLMGIAFLYGGNPAASFYIEHLNLGAGHLNILTGVGLVFMIVALGFKVSAAPFHFWTPDVYEGAPTVITSFMSTIVKVAGFFAFVRLFETSFGQVHNQWQLLIVIILIATLLVGNITAIFQQSLKRMLAYSSIAQAGYMLFALFALNNQGREGLLLYAAGYSLATIGIFAVLARVGDQTIDGFNGLSRKQPFIALSLVIFFLSLTGIPLTLGFMSKFYMLMAAAGNGNFIWLVIIAVIFSAISSYYYFRVIQAMYFRPVTDGDDFEKTFGGSFKVVLGITAALIILLGVLPEILISWMYH